MVSGDTCHILGRFSTHLQVFLSTTTSRTTATSTLVLSKHQTSFSSLGSYLAWPYTTPPSLMSPCRLFYSGSYWPTRQHTPGPQLHSIVPLLSFHLMILQNSGVSSCLFLHRVPWLTVCAASLAAGLQQLLDYDGDVEETFCRDFIFEDDRYGQAFQVPLCHKGENRAVTNSNRVEFVELYVKYVLETSVSRQFEPFKRGFFSVCGGNALSLFRPEEIELLVRGSDEPLNVATLRAVAIYDGWKQDERASNEAVLTWFWDLFTEATPNEQRALLSFITGSDRLPAMGATSLIIKLSCLGNDTQRFPMARTCFNMIGLYRYSSKEQLSSKLWTAVAESEGFGLK